MRKSSAGSKEMTIEKILERKLRYEGGKLFAYLDQIEESIQQSISGSKLIAHYGLKSKGNSRCDCPFQDSGTYKYAFSFSDRHRTFKCYVHGEFGTYLDFIVKMEGFRKNEINEAKIFAALHFSGIDLGFNSIDDHDRQLEYLIRKEYNSNGSLISQDYYHVSLLKNGNVERKSSLEYSLKTKVQLPLKSSKYSMDINMDTYMKSLKSAENSLLIKTLESSPELNSIEMLQKYMFSKYDISIETALDFGLILFEKKSQSRLPDFQFHFLDNRLLVPYRDYKSKITVGYTARAIGMKETPKYINIADFGIKVGVTYEKNYFTPFLIGNFLFNLDRIIGKKIDDLFIVEGPVDAIKMTELGYNCVAVSGVYLLDQHISLIKRHLGTELNINLLFDAESSQIGHVNSKAASSKLIAVGFKSVKDVHLNGISGKDITEMAIKIRDDARLRKIIDDNVMETTKIVLYDAAKENDGRILMKISECQKKRIALSEKQLKILKRRFLDNEIDKIGRRCSRGKIAMLIGKIIRNEEIHEREWTSSSDN